MFTIYYSPHPALEEFVESIYLIGHKFADNELFSPLYNFMPTHNRFICFNLEDPVRVKRRSGDFKDGSSSMITGLHLEPITLDFGKKHLAMMVLLKPCGLYRLLGISMKEIIDCDFDASLIFGKEINEVIEQLINTPEYGSKNRIIQDYLLKKLTKLKPKLPVDQVMILLVRSQGHLSMDFMASQACISVRQLERQSIERIGLPPKFFARMIRFSEAYKFKERNPNSSWTEIAYRFRYFDQMHLIRDFRCFSGITPSKIKEAEILHSVRYTSLLN